MSVLCYVDGNTAWFTTSPLDEQWGDDWNDAPYEHNAGTPYSFTKHDAERGRTPYELTRIVWMDADLETPDAWHTNSPYSVEAINKGSVPWLVSSRWADHSVRIFAGVTVEEFKALIRKAGGTVYVEEIPVVAG